MRIVLIIIISGILTALTAQDQDPARYIKKEAELKTLFDLLYADTPDIDKTELANNIVKEFETVLAEEQSFDYSWSKLDKIGIIASQDSQIKIFTWHLPLSRDHYSYFGLIQTRPKKDRVRLFLLQDNHQMKQDREEIDQSPENWHGKLYYSIVDKAYKRNVYYTLLGMDYNNSISTIKTIEVLTIRRNRPVFLKQRFSDGTDLKDRIVLEYSSQVAISVRYNQQMDQIVFDHLVPFHPVYTGNYEFYGPDGSHDGFEFVDGIWILREDVDARNPY
ncbi:MAG TPA: hypothetical protein ENN61_03200 [Bacteroidaceae bacterium]|nr:hypothetical protein [Bacteroidaceae bacterium]